MKKIFQLSAASFFLLLLVSCKKESGTALKSGMSFNYNGKQYLLTNDVQGVQNWGAGDIGIYIDRPDLFNGRINYFRAGCAYLDAIGTAVYSSGNCELTYSDGSPVDSNTVYVYKSGSINLTYSNCFTKSGYDIVTDSNYTYQVCDLSGIFDLVLATKNNQAISLTEGVVNIYSLRR